MSLPRWISQSAVRLRRPNDPPGLPPLLHATVSARDTVLGWHSFAARALALRQVILPGRIGRAGRPYPRWLRQMAVLAVGGVPAQTPRLTEALREHEPLGEPLRPGTMLVAHTRRKKKGVVEAHCEAALLQRLRREDVGLLEALSPLMLYSVMCPCHSCGEEIAQFAAERPAVRVEVCYERRWIPEDCAESHGGGFSDATSLEVMRKAGVAVGCIEQLAVTRAAPPRALCREGIT